MCARKCATIQLVWILKFAFAPEKLPGLSRNGPLEKEKESVRGTMGRGKTEERRLFPSSPTPAPSIFRLYGTCLHISHNAPYLPPLPQILHNLCVSFLLGITAVLREIENNAYAKKGLGDIQGALSVEMCQWRNAYWDTQRKPLPRRECLLGKSILVLSQGVRWGICTLF